MDKPYHHGDLPAALRSATVELVAERGPTGFSLREVARRAGVSHAAPAHHFGDAKGLLTSVAAEGFERLADALEAAGEVSTNAAERLAECGKAYVSTGLKYPGHFGVMIREELVDQGNEALLEASLRAYQSLAESVNLVREQLNPDLDVDTAATLCWSAMQGLVDLAPKLDHVAQQTGTTTAPLEDLVERFTALFITGFQKR